MTVQSQSKQGRKELRELQDAAAELTRADFYLACAARILEENTSRIEWADEAQQLFKRTLKLRETIYSEVGR